MLERDIVVKLKFALVSILDAILVILSVLLPGGMLLTYPERLADFDDLWTNCAGDEFDDPDACACFAYALCFDFYGGKVKFVPHWRDGAYNLCWPVSAFVPQS